jgi:uncharacterized cofD-like protein
VIDLIARADQIVMGPGSLYSSVLAALVVPAVRQAVASSPAQKVYVTNLRGVPQTQGFAAGDYEAALHAHGVHPEVIVVHGEAGHPPSLASGGTVARVVVRPVAGHGQTVHDPELLADALAAIYAERPG